MKWPLLLESLASTLAPLTGAFTCLKSAVRDQHMGPIIRFLKRMLWWCEPRLCMMASWFFTAYCTCCGRGLSVFLECCTMLKSWEGECNMRKRMPATWLLSAMKVGGVVGGKVVRQCMSKVSFCCIGSSVSYFSAIPWSLQRCVCTWLLWYALLVLHAMGVSLPHWQLNICRTEETMTCI